MSFLNAPKAVKFVRYALQALDVAEGAIAMTEDQQHDPQYESEQDEQKRTVFEELELEGRQLVERVKELIKEGNVRRLIIKDPDGKYLLEIPLTVGVVAGGVFALTTPVLAALGALAALVTKVHVEVVREVEESDNQPEE